MKNFCDLHIDYVGEKCPTCELDIDEYGNTEDSFQYCSFPNCGCDGARLCMAKEGASEHSVMGNVEGMWCRNDAEALKAKCYLLDLCNRKSRGR